MSTAESYRRASQAAYDEPLDVFVDGDTSEDVSKYLPLASGALTEVVSTELKKKEEEKRQAALKSSEGYKAQQAAIEAQKQAAMLQADAITEADPSGPKHKAAAAAALQAQSAAAKAAYFAAGATPGGAALFPGGGHGGAAPSMLTTKNLLIAGGVVLAGLVGWKVLSGKKR
jgi:hypothetical protein